MRLIILLFLTSLLSHAQQSFQIKGRVTSDNETLPFANIYLENTIQGTTSNDNGTYLIEKVDPGIYTIVASFTGFNTVKREIKITDKNVTVDFDLEGGEALSEITITGTLKAVNRLESPVPVEVYTSTFLKKNPTPIIFEALQKCERRQATN